MNLKTKRIIILILDILIAIWGGFSFYETNEIQHINIKYAIIVILLVIIRIFVDFMFSPGCYFECAKYVFVFNKPI